MNNKRGKIIVLYLFWIFFHIFLLISSKEINENEYHLFYPFQTTEIQYYDFSECFFYSFFPIFLYLFQKYWNIHSATKAIFEILKNIAVNFGNSTLNLINSSYINWIKIILSLILFVGGIYSFTQGFGSIDEETVIDFNKNYPDIVKIRSTLDNFPTISPVTQKKELLQILILPGKALITQFQNEIKQDKNYKFYTEQKPVHDQLKLKVNYYVDLDKRLGLTDQEYQDAINSRNELRRLKSDRRFNIGTQLESKIQEGRKQLDDYDDIVRTWQRNDPEMQERERYTEFYINNNSKNMMIIEPAISLLSFGFNSSTLVFSIIGIQSIKVNLINKLDNIKEATIGFSQRELMVMDTILKIIANIYTLIILLNGIFYFNKKKFVVLQLLELAFHVFFIICFVSCFIFTIQLRDGTFSALLIIFISLFSLFALSLIKELKTRKFDN
jgi:hypothetical protein